jgi:hypothetical protein
MSFTNTPGTAPAQRRFPPEVPQDWVDPGGNTPVDHCWRVQNKFADGYQGFRDAHSRDIDPAILKDANASRYQISNAALALGPALAAVKTQVDQAHQNLADAVAGLTVPDGQHDAARRIWERSRHQLDAADGIPTKVAVAQNLIANATGLELGTLQEELRAYFAALKLPGGKPVPMDWLVPALSARIDGQDDAKAQAALLAKQHTVLVHNDGALRRSVASNTAPPQLLDPSRVDAAPYTNGQVR